MGKAARRKNERRARGEVISPPVVTAEKIQHFNPNYNPLRYAISWADFSELPKAANDDVVELPVPEVALAVPPQQRKKFGPKPKPLPKEVREAQLWGLYADLWDSMEDELSPKERRALQKALARNSGTLEELVEDDTEDSEIERTTRRSSLVDDDEEYVDEEEIDYNDFFEDFDKNY
ncbi:hypothetical protein [Pseudomonas sp. Marseille-Q7302]